MDLQKDLSPGFLLEKIKLGKDKDALFEVTFHPGENIFKQGEPLTHLVLIKKGLVKVVFDYLGRSLALIPLQAGQMVGSPGFLTDYKHHFTVTAMGTVVVDFVPIGAYRDLLESEPGFAVQAIHYLNQLHIKTYKRLISLTLKSMYGRVADTILLLADDLYGSLEFDLSFSRKDLADFSALSKESVVRVLSIFTRDGMIRTKGRHLEILNREKLEQME